MRYDTILLSAKRFLFLLSGKSSQPCGGGEVWDGLREKKKNFPMIFRRASGGYRLTDHLGSIVPAGFLSRVRARAGIARVVTSR